MRFWLVFFISLCFFHAKSNPPIYFFPDLIRFEQTIWQQENFNRPDGHVRFTGDFGLHPIAMAKFGLNVNNIDSLNSFSAAQTLWLDYFCEFKDSSKADIALIYGPSIMRSMSKEEFHFSQARIKKYKVTQDYSLNDCCKNSIVSFVELEPVILLSDIPRFHAYQVKKGDSLWRIRKNYPMVSIDDLIRINRGTDVIYPGQILNIPF